MCVRIIEKKHREGGHAMDKYILNKIIEVAGQGPEKYRQEQLDFLRDLCNIDCGSRNIEGNKKVVDCVSELLNDIGAQVNYIEEPGYGIHVVARISPEKPTGKVILHAHLDTVFKEGDAAAHPFHVDDKFAYGLGVADCKGGLTTILFAVKIMKEAELLPDKELVMIFNCDEEIGSPTGQKVFKKESDGAEAAISFEPGRKQNGILTSRYGVAEGTVRITGKSAHACMDGGPGASAVVELANIILFLHGKADPDMGIHYNVAPVKGGIGPSVVADIAEASFWVTFNSEKAYEQVKKDIFEDLPKAKMVEGSETDISLQMEFPSMERCSENVELYKKLRKAGTLIGMDLPEEMSKSPADCNFFSALGIPTVDGLGPYMYNIHTTDEHMLISSLPERIKLVGIMLALL